MFKKKYTIYVFVFFLLIFLLYFLINKNKKDELAILEPIQINLLTSVHPNLSWNFEPVEKKIFAKPGEVTTITYVVENLGSKESTGIATFAYFPSHFGKYITKLNCFCYDAQTLQSKEKDKFTLILLIDPEVTKDNRTKELKEATIQFTFFDYKEYKEKKN